MFGSLLREFEEDPFFTEPFSAHQEHVRHMMRSFSEPFGRDPFLSITGGRARTLDHAERSDSQVALREDQRGSDVKDHFHTMDNIMANMRNRMFDVQRNFDRLSVGPDAHSFSSSSVMTYSKVGDEPAKVFQASSQTRKAPGGIKETRQALKDSESGVEKLAVGHHIQERAHVIKKSRNYKTGNEEVHQDFVNLDEVDAPTFDEEWQSKVSRFVRPGGRTHLPVQAPQQRSAHPGALRNSEDTSRRSSMPSPNIHVEVTGRDGFDRRNVFGYLNWTLYNLLASMNVWSGNALWISDECFWLASFLHPVYGHYLNTQHWIFSRSDIHLNLKNCLNIK